jgi:hypothetical protein
LLYCLPCEATWVAGQPSLAQRRLLATAVESWPSARHEVPHGRGPDRPVEGPLTSVTVRGRSSLSSVVVASWKAWSVDGPGGLGVQARVAGESRTRRGSAPGVPATRVVDRTCPRVKRSGRLGGGSRQMHEVCSIAILIAAPGDENCEDTPAAAGDVLTHWCVKPGDVYGAGSSGALLGCRCGRVGLSAVRRPSGGRRMSRPGEWSGWFGQPMGRRADFLSGGPIARVTPRRYGSCHLMTPVG